jgi:hypothetical protein
MNQKTAKKIRKQVYGDLSLRERKYYKAEVEHKPGKNDHIRIADDKRREYQLTKKAFLETAR